MIQGVVGCSAGDQQQVVELVLDDLAAVDATGRESVRVERRGCPAEYDQVQQ